MTDEAQVTVEVTLTGTISHEITSDKLKDVVTELIVRGVNAISWPGLFDVEVTTRQVGGASIFRR